MASPLNGLDRPIAVAGFMAVGKSTVGRLLAHRLRRPFADADAEVERRAGCSVRALFERDGEAAFRALEETVTRDLLLREDAPVIALGGGALVSEATRALVRERAFCAWLDVPFATAWERVGAPPAPARWPATGRASSSSVRGAPRSTARARTRSSRARQRPRTWRRRSPSRSGRAPGWPRSRSPRAPSRSSTRHSGSPRSCP